MTTLVECRHAEECGACAFLTSEYPDQLVRKEQILLRAMESVRPGIGRKMLSCLPSPAIQGYRNRARMAVGISRDRTVRLGYFRESSREIVDAPDCRVLVPDLLETTRRLRRLLERSTAAFPRELRHIDIRCGTRTSGQHLILVLRTNALPHLPIDQIRRECPSVEGISINLNPSAGPQVVKGKVDHLWGKRELFFASHGLQLRVSPGSFFQVNLSLLDEIHHLMADFLGEGDCLADLYSGVGTHGLALRDRFRRLVFVEGVRSAVADTKATLERYSIDHASIVAKPVERSAKQILAARPDAVLMNPSRSGATPIVLETLVESPTRRLAYLSCNPETLARDSSFLVEHGFELVSVQPIDIMPQTQQVEALAFLRRVRFRSPHRSDQDHDRGSSRRKSRRAPFPPRQRRSLPKR